MSVMPRRWLWHGPVWRINIFKKKNHPQRLWWRTYDLFAFCFVFEAPGNPVKTHCFALIFVFVENINGTARRNWFSINFIFEATERTATRKHYAQATGLPARGRKQESGQPGRQGRLKIKPLRSIVYFKLFNYETSCLSTTKP